MEVNLDNDLSRNPPKIHKQLINVNASEKISKYCLTAFLLMSEVSQPPTGSSDDRRLNEPNS